MSWYLSLSIVATVLSVIAMTKELFIPIFFRPNLLLSVGTTGEYLSDLTTNGNSLGTTVRYNLFRLKIENKASFSASKDDGLYLRILNIYKDKTELQPFNTMVMRWVSASFSEDLSRGEHLFVNLVTVYHDEYKAHYAYPGHFGGAGLALAAGFPMGDLRKAGNFSYRIGIFGKRLSGKTYTVNFHFEPRDQDPISNLTLEEISNKSDEN